MSRRLANLRRALEAEGLSEEEISEALEMHDDEGTPADRARAVGIPAAYCGVPFDAVEEDGNGEAIVATRAWANGRGITEGLFLWSEGYGNSKTMLASIAAQVAMAERNLTIRWLDVARLMTDLNLSFNNPQYERAADRLQAPGRGECIVLDDLDKIPATDRNIQPIYVLINDVVNAKAPLILTANRHLDDLARDFGDRFGKALASRLVGHCLDVEVSGRDRRVEP